ncbi:RHS repeat-associated core domain-containing protein [Streptomyces sp. NPDC057939]|uniref:RHS repeat-associated core domain-containing protein n=1 Tax=Streptomyces sp. NPDC057939 TaxID=3346284 RepID=UPI0036ECC2BC
MVAVAGPGALSPTPRPRTIDGGAVLGAREYDPRTGTFLSVDPVLVLDSGQFLNAYGYADNSPVSTSDPAGPCAELDCPTRVCATCRNFTPGHAPRPGDDRPGSGSANSAARSGARANYGSSYKPSLYEGRPLNCPMKQYGCGGAQASPAVDPSPAAVDSGVAPASSRPERLPPGRCRALRRPVTSRS